jgi:O-antigen/teichoic acid export membrane protein
MIETRGRDIAGDAGTSGLRLWTRSRENGHAESRRTGAPGGLESGPRMKGLKQAAARGVAWNLAQNLIGRVLALAVIAILGRILAKSDFGAVAVCLAVTAFGELLATQGYGEFIAHRKDITDEHLDTAFWLNAALGIVLTALIVLCAGPLAEELGEPSVTPILRVLSLSVLIRAVSVVPTGMLMRELKFRSLSLRSLAASVFAGIVGIVGAFSGLGIWSLVLQVLIGDFVSTAVLWRATAWRPGFRISRQCLRQLNSFGAPVLGAAALVLVGRRLDIMLIAGSLGLLTLAGYSMAQRLFHIANQVLNKSSDAVTLSALARLVETPDRRRDAFYKIIELSSVLYFPVYAGLALLAEPLIVTIFTLRRSSP